MLFAGSFLFTLPFDQSTPFYVDQAYLTANPNTALSLGDATNKCILYTMVFQSFVFMQLFNQINARKLGDKEYNVFTGFFNNPLFLAITILSFAVQLAMTQYGGPGLRTTPLPPHLNLICLAIGAFSLLWAVTVKAFLPSVWFSQLAVPEQPMDD